MPTVDRESPIFTVPQSDGTNLTLDFTTPGPFGDFAFTARIPNSAGTVIERIYSAHHTDEPAIFVAILQHWARAAHPDDILAGLDRAEAVLRFLTDGLQATTQSENDFHEHLRHIEALAAKEVLPVHSEHSHEAGEDIALATTDSGLSWTSRRTPPMTFVVPASHLWALVTGMMWRTYDHDSIPLSRLNTGAYEEAISAFREATETRNDHRLTTPELLQTLSELLGTKLVAYLSSAPDTRTVQEWADPTPAKSPPDEVVARLRIAHSIVALLSKKDSAEVIQAWFQGLNPLLEDTAPARALREPDITVAAAQVMVAARDFVASTSDSPELSLNPPLGASG